ncbi:MAG: DUF945 family protein, partial [Gammaproteobacteria bacterium]
MNKTVQTTALAVLIAAAPMIGTAAPRKAPAAKAAKPAAPAAASPLSEAWTALTNELNESMEGGDMVFRLDKVYGKPLSAPTQAKLKRVFGDTDPATLTRQANAAGGFDYRFTLVPFRYVDADGGALNWTELVATESIDAAQSQISGAFKWERLDYKAKGLNITVNGVNGVGEQSRSGGDTWTGKGSGRVESIVFDDPSKPGLAPRMEAITYEASSTARGKLVDGAFTMNIARIA